MPLALILRAFDAFKDWFTRRAPDAWPWCGRSVLVQSAGEPLRALAAHIHLNPIRAEMVEDPKDYRWSGYGAAMSGDQIALDQDGSQAHGWTGER